MSGIIYLTLHFLQRFLGVLRQRLPHHFAPERHLNKSAKFIMIFIHRLIRY